MPLTSIHELMRKAVAGGYAVGFFESWSIDSLQGAIDAAETTQSPIIVGFNGEFLSGSTRETEERIAWYGALGRAAAASASVPCGVIFNECSHDDRIREAIHAGFNLVMPADASAPLDQYARRVRGLADLAHAHGVGVEAELGELPFGVDDEPAHAGTTTDPDTAARFVAETGIDLLAVSVGNVHVMLKGSQPLDLGHLQRLRDAVSVPFVLHGGTGIDRESLQAAIAMGIAKVNYGTYVKQRYLAAVREALRTDHVDPHALIGKGGPEDLLVIGRHAVRDAVLERITWLGCCGKAAGD